MFFQRAMNSILGRVTFIKFFLDNIIVFSHSIEEHERDLIFVLNKLSDNKIGINFSKSHSFKKKMNYLGHVIISTES